MLKKREVKKEDVSFVSNGNKLVGQLCYPSGVQNYPGILYLHGGGRSHKGRYDDWQEYLAIFGYASLSFNFRGVLPSEGDFEDGTLSHRLDDASAALEFLESRVADKSRIGLVGSSMGAHVACRLVEKYPNIKVLILQSAAAYSKEAEDLPLNEKFTEVIRREHSWRDPAAFESIINYKGHIMVIYGENDDVIPNGVKEMYKAAVKSGEDYIVLKNAFHRLLSPQTEEAVRARQELYDESLKFFVKNL